MRGGQKSANKLVTRWPPTLLYRCSTLSNNSGPIRSAKNRCVPGGAQSKAERSENQDSECQGRFNFRRFRFRLQSGTLLTSPQRKRYKVICIDYGTICGLTNKSRGTIGLGPRAGHSGCSNYYRHGNRNRHLKKLIICSSGCFGDGRSDDTRRSWPRGSNSITFARTEHSEIESGPFRAIMQQQSSATSRCKQKHHLRTLRAGRISRTGGDVERLKRHMQKADRRCS